MQAVEQKEDSYEDDPDGSAKSVEEADSVGDGAVISERRTELRHLAEELPDTKGDEQEGDQPVSGKGVEEARVADQEDSAERDEPDRPGRETVSGIDGIGIYWIDGRSIGRNWGWWRSRIFPVPAGGRRRRVGLLVVGVGAVGWR